MPETLSAASFFVVGGTLRRDAPSYIERAADRKLYEALRAGELCYVLTARQMGKSSLMVRTAGRLREEEGTRVAVLDLTGLGQNLSADQWYNGLLERVGQQFQLEDQLEVSWWNLSHLGPMQRFMRAVSDVLLPTCRQRIVIFIDEIDAVRSLPFSTDEFFAGVRECHNRRSSDAEMERLTFCLLGVATPSDLIRDTRTTPFNVGRRIELSDFSEQEATPLIQGFGVEKGVGLSLLRRVIYWTGGHPYLTQRLCQSVAQAGSVKSSLEVDRLCGDLFLSNRARERDDNLLFVRERILRSEVDTPGLLTLYDKVRAGKKVWDDETSPLISVLRLSGITRVEHGTLRVRNRVYIQVFDHDWVVANMPGAELRRQHAAYKRGLKLALSITLPLLLLGAGIAYRNVYLTQVSLSLPSKTQPPPAFWASFRVAAAGTDSQAGGILLRTGEPEVDVFVNNFQYGRTTRTGDLKIPLPQANYEIRLEKAGFQSIKLPLVEVLKNQENQLRIRMQRRVIVATSLMVRNGVPGTLVRLDGNGVGTIESDGTYTHDTSPGIHTVELQKDGYMTRHYQEDFALGKKVVIDGQLTQDSETAAYQQVQNSMNLAAMKQYLRTYPNSKNAATVRKRAEELEWNSLNKADLMAVDAFRKEFPQGQHASDAQQLETQIQAEQGDYIEAMQSNSLGGMQAFLSKHPSSQYAPRIREEISKNSERQAVLQVLKDYEQVYNQHDLEGILRLWPTCPDRFRKKLKEAFRASASENLKMQMIGQPEIVGDFATVQYEETRSGQVSTNARATMRLVRQNGRWLIANL